jgi:hypothetical protein
MAKDFGVIEPIGTRWIWPFSQMEEGDFFHVDWADKKPTQLRQYVSVRASQLGVYFKTIKQSDEKPGFAKVIRIPAPEEREGAKVEENLIINWIEARALVHGCYHISANNPMAAMDAGWRRGFTHFYEAERIKEPPRRAYEIVGEGTADLHFAIEFEPEGVRMTWLAEHENLKTFTAKRLADIMG